MSNEQWRLIAGYEGLYEVSDHGRVRSLDRIDSRGNRAWGRILRQEVRPTGHLRVTLCSGGTTKRIFVHRLVLTAFIGPLPVGMQACHNDGNPANNVPANLRWDTIVANARDRRLHGTDCQLRKTHCPHGHEYSAENTYLNHKGYRRCRACTLAGQRAKKESINARRREMRASRRAA